MRIVTFLKNAPPYNPGETAGLPDDIASKLVADGAATYVGQAPPVVEVKAEVRTAAVARDDAEPEAVEPADTQATGDFDTVAIPGNWRAISWMRRRGIAVRLGADRDTIDEAGAIATIEAELARRSKEG